MSRGSAFTRASFFSTSSLLASASPPRRRLVVSIHDVAPETFAEVRFLAGALDALHARPRVYKVIPEYLPSAPELIAFLRAEQDEGSEIVLHGYSHRRVGAWRGPWRRRLRARLFAPEDAEFLSLSPDQVESRLLKGRSILDQAGLVASGFCAPGWIESPDVRATLRRAGFRFDVAMTHVVDLKSDRKLWTDWVGDMGTGGVQDSLVGVANFANRTVMPRFSAARVFLHPQRAHARASRQMLDWLAGLVAARTLVTFSQLLA